MATTSNFKKHLFFIRQL